MNNSSFTKNTRTLLALAAVGLLITGVLLHAGGPLTPPPGPVTSNFKTLTEVEPRIVIDATNTPGDADSLFKITLPGSYYLTGNITGTVRKRGITITSSGVTIDLNGFGLAGAAGSLSLDGIKAEGNNQLTNITVKNGSVRGWGNSGVMLGFGSVPNESCHVEGVRATGNKEYGILIPGDSTVSNCSASYNGLEGISTFIGIAGFDAPNGSSLSNCSASKNNGGGIRLSAGNTVSNCSASFNTGTGISAGTGSTVSTCTAYDNTGNGIQVGTGCAVTDCTAYSNNNFGILAGAGCAISNCALNTNFSHGISVGSDSSVTGCTARENGYHGILATADCVINGNTCNDNGARVDITGAGIHTTGANNRIEGNNCANNKRGIECATGSTGNLIIRNSASSNAINFVFVANNRYGNILDITAATAAVNGNSAVGTLATTDPHANFRY